jgi:hypothetical protein
MFDSPVKYNGFNLKEIDSLSSGVRRGSVLEVFDYSRSQGVGYTEKRAQDDGLDASDVYMGPRYINLAGTLYGEDEPDLHDLLQDLRTCLTPTSAYAFDKWDQGYIPLEFTLPTKDSRFGVRTAGGFERLVEYRARPVGQPSFSLRRDGGGSPGAQGDIGGVAVTWSAQLECKDPRMYVRPDTWLQWTTAVSGLVIRNRGDYPAPLDILLIVNSAPANSYIEVDCGGSTIRIRVGGLATNTIVRYSGELKVLTIDNASGGTADTLRMDLFALLADKTHPKVNPSDDDKYPGDGRVNIRFSGAPTFKNGTRFMYSESFA